MIINIIGHGLQWGEQVGNRIQEHEVDIPIAPHFNSVSFYCPAGEGFNGPDAYTIINGDWREDIEEINDIHRIPEHFVFPHQQAWEDIYPLDPVIRGRHIHPGPNDPHYVAPNVEYEINEINLLRLRQIIIPRIPHHEPQLVISPINNTCISLSWLISNIPHIIEEHPQLAPLPDQDNYIYQWLVCRDEIEELNPHNNAASLEAIRDAAIEVGQEIDRLLWEP